MAYINCAQYLEIFCNMSDACETAICSLIANSGHYSGKKFKMLSAFREGKIYHSHRALDNMLQKQSKTICFKKRGK